MLALRQLSTRCSTSGKAFEVAHGAHPVVGEPEEILALLARLHVGGDKHLYAEHLLHQALHLGIVLTADLLYGQPMLKLVDEWLGEVDVVLVGIDHSLRSCVEIVFHIPVVLRAFRVDDDVACQPIATLEVFGLDAHHIIHRLLLRQFPTGAAKIIGDDIRAVAHHEHLVGLHAAQVLSRRCASSTRGEEQQGCERGLYLIHVGALPSFLRCSAVRTPRRYLVLARHVWW